MMSVKLSETDTSVLCIARRDAKMPSEMFQGHCHSRCRIELMQKPLKADLHHFLGARIHWNFLAFSQYLLEACSENHQIAEDYMHIVPSGWEPLV